MKKSVILIAIAVAFSVSTLNAKNDLNASTSYEVVSTKVSVSPFCMAIVKGDLETVKKLIDLGTDVNKKSNGLTPAMYAARYNRVDVLKLLVAHGAKLDSRTDNGMTAEKFAKKSNATDTLSYIQSLES